MMSVFSCLFLLPLVTHQILIVLMAMFGRKEFYVLESDVQVSVFKSLCALPGL